MQVEEEGLRYGHHHWAKPSWSRQEAPRTSISVSAFQQRPAVASLQLDKLVWCFFAMRTGTIRNHGISMRGFWKEPIVRFGSGWVSWERVRESQSLPCWDAREQRQFILSRRGRPDEKRIKVVNDQEIEATWQFPGGPVVRTLSFHSRRHEFNTWLGN